MLLFKAQGNKRMHGNAPTPKTDILIYEKFCHNMFNFGQSIRRWISLFFSNREAYILLGGELTKKILLEQGVP